MRLSLWISTMLLLAMGAMGLAGCASDGQGYRVGSLHDTSVRTISVPIFNNRTYYNGLEARLTEAIITEIHRTTPWQVVRTAQAQTTLQGTITEAAIRTLSTDIGYIQQSAFTITVDFTWIDNARGEPRVTRERFSSTGTFVPVRGVGERIEVGQREAIAELARDIVQELQSDW